MTTENAVASKLVKLGARNIEEGLVQVQTSAELEAKLRKSEEECKAATEGAARLLEAAREREGENQDLRQMLQKVQAEKELWQSRYQQARPKASAEHSCECQPQDPIVVPAASPHISAMKRQLHHLESTNSELLAQKQDLSTKLTASANREAGLARMIADAAATQAQLDEQCEVTAALVEENQRLYASLQSHEDSEAALLRRLQAAEAPTPPRRTHTNGATTPRASHATAFSALGIIAAPPYPDSDSEVDWWSGASPGPHSDSVQAGRRPSFMPSPQQSGVVHESLWGPGPAAQLDMDTYQGPGAPAGFAQPRRAQTVPWY
ncbi:hypothetical protein EDC01DRAFT_650592 [Geopyxis carbonaria]|nr:hypothetical protein EDC01DRAFT_650592 [Geopyxis carbonaria]